MLVELVGASGVGKSWIATRLTTRRLPEDEQVTAATAPPPGGTGVLEKIRAEPRHRAP